MDTHAHLYPDSSTTENRSNGGFGDTAEWRLQSAKRKPGCRARGDLSDSRAVDLSDTRAISSVKPRPPLAYYRGGNAQVKDIIGGLRRTEGQLKRIENQF
mgnify:CR=1 FL=1